MVLLSLSLPTLTFRDGSLSYGSLHVIDCLNNSMSLCMMKGGNFDVFPRRIKFSLASSLFDHISRSWNSSLWKQMTSATDNFDVNDDENPYEALGVNPLERFEIIKGTYMRKRKDAERRNDQTLVTKLEKAYDKIMMSQLSKRKQGLTFGAVKVSKEIRYADKRSLFPWSPRFARPSQRDILINVAISTCLGVWAAILGSADWKPLQFLIFSYMFLIFNKLKQFETPEAPVSLEDEDHTRRMKSGKRLLRSIGLVFSCVAIASLAFTGLLNLYEFCGSYIPLALINSQELFVTLLSAVLLFVMGTYYR